MLEISLRHILNGSVLNSVVVFCVTCGSAAIYGEFDVSTVNAKVEAKIWVSGEKEKNQEYKHIILVKNYKILTE